MKGSVSVPGPAAEGVAVTSWSDGEGHEGEMTHGVIIAGAEGVCLVRLVCPVSCDLLPRCFTPDDPLFDPSTPDLSLSRVLSDSPLRFVRSREQHRDDAERPPTHRHLTDEMSRRYGVQT
ncbi:unnamed protein product [Boreogadus saida]